MNSGKDQIQLGHKKARQVSFAGIPCRASGLYLIFLDNSTEEKFFCSIYIMSYKIYFGKVNFPINQLKSYKNQTKNSNQILSCLGLGSPDLGLECPILGQGDRFSITQLEDQSDYGFLKTAEKPGGLVGEVKVKALRCRLSALTLQRRRSRRRSHVSPGLLAAGQGRGVYTSAQPYRAQDIPQNVQSLPNLRHRSHESKVLACLARANSENGLQGRGKLGLCISERLGISEIAQSVRLSEQNESQAKAEGLRHAETAQSSHRSSAPDSYRRREAINLNPNKLTATSGFEGVIL